jgi:2-(1,2-epoxy-1,2-dihydrophenyl)acetyl-CoA isomerase
MEIIGFDKPISSEQALAWGLVTKVVEDGRALEEAWSMARDLTKGSLHSFGWCKELLTDSFNTTIETQIERERMGISRCGAHPDGQEGLNLKFVDKIPFSSRSERLFATCGGPEARALRLAS